MYIIFEYYRKCKKILIFHALCYSLHHSCMINSTAHDRNFHHKRSSLEILILITVRTRHKAVSSSYDNFAKDQKTRDHLI